MAKGSSAVTYWIIKGFQPEKYANKNMSVDTIVKMKEVFDIFDYDHSGQISIDELINTIKALNMEKEAANILSIVQNSNADEEMDFAIFLEIFGVSDNQNEASLQSLYEAFDPKGTGCFGPEDFEAVAAQVGENFSTAEVDQMIDYADKDRDGGINFEEFVAVVTKQYPKIWLWKTILWIII